MEQCFLLWRHKVTFFIQLSFLVSHWQASSSVRALLMFQISELKISESSPPRNKRKIFLEVQSDTSHDKRASIHSAIVSQSKQRSKLPIIERLKPQYNWKENTERHKLLSTPGMLAKVLRMGFEFLEIGLLILPATKNRKKSIYLRTISNSKYAVTYAVVQEYTKWPDVWSSSRAATMTRRQQFSLTVFESSCFMPLQPVEPFKVKG